MLPTLKHYVNRRFSAGAHRLPPADPTVYLPKIHIDDEPDPHYPAAPPLPEPLGWQYGPQLYDVRRQRWHQFITFAGRWLLLGAVVLVSVGFLKKGG